MNASRQCKVLKTGFEFSALSLNFKYFNKCIIIRNPQNILSLNSMSFQFFAKINTESCSKPFLFCISSFWLLGFTTMFVCYRKSEDVFRTALKMFKFSNYDIVRQNFHTRDLLYDFITDRMRMSKYYYARIYSFLDTFICIN